MNKRFLLGAVCVAAVFITDQLSKAAALAAATSLSNGIDVLPFMRLVLVRNDGVTFGMFGGVAPSWLLASVSAAVVLALLCWFWYAHSSLLQLSLGLMIGGAIGNIADRVRYGAVTDFLDFHFAGYHWPAFNLADTAIVVAVSLIIFESFSTNRQSEP